MRLKHPDLLLASAVALANVVWALLPYRFPAVGITLALPLVFALTGYTLTAVLFHKRSLDPAHRVLLSLGLSVAIDIAGGLALNVFPIGLRPASWSVLLAFLTALFAALAAYLRRAAAIPRSPHNVGTRLVASAPLITSIRLSWHSLVLFGLAATVVILSVAFSAYSVAQQPRAGFTQFWMLPTNQPGKSCAVRLGIQSEELTTTTYRIDVTANGAQITTSSPVELAPRQAWEQLIPVVFSDTGSVYIEAQLYRVDKPSAAYRRVNITLYVANGKGCRLSLRNIGVAL